MPFTLPDKGEPVNNLQSILYQEYIDALIEGIDGKNCVMSGGAVAQTVSPSEMSVTVGKSAVMSNGVLKANAGGVIAIQAADPTNPRIDLVVIDSSGVLQVRKGTAAAATTPPKPPARTANDVLLASVMVNAAAAQINSTDIDDKRVVHTIGPFCVYKTTSKVTINTNSGIVALATFVLPSGLFLSGKLLRFRCGGNYLANSGTPTFAFAVSYGGATLFTDATVAAGTSAIRGAWWIDLELIATADAAQTLNGIMVFETPGAKVDPPTGTGDLGVATSVITPVRGTLAVDSNAGDQSFTVTIQMSVSNLSDETVLDFATAELL